MGGGRGSHSSSSYYKDGVDSIKEMMTHFLTNVSMAATKFQ
jgi:hypothetical protein